MWTSSASTDLEYQRQASKIWKIERAPYPYSFSAVSLFKVVLLSYNSRIVYSSNFSANAKATLVKGEGDGTVNKRSLAACTKWQKEMSGRHTFQYHTFNNTDHLQILKEESPSEYVKDLIHNLNRELQRSEPVIFIAP